MDFEFLTMTNLFTYTGNSSEVVRYTVMQKGLHIYPIYILFPMKRLDLLRFLQFMANIIGIHFPGLTENFLVSSATHF